MTKYKNSIDEIHTLIKANTPIIWVTTHEEERCINDIAESIVKPLKQKLFIWSSYQGIVKFGEHKQANRASGDYNETWIPPNALKKIKDSVSNDTDNGHIYIFRDFNTVLTEPVIRQLKDMYDFLGDNRRKIIILSAVLSHGPGGGTIGIPASLEKQLVVVNYELPNPEQISGIVTNILDNLKENSATVQKSIKLDYTADEMKEIVRASQGLTKTEIDISVATSIVYRKHIDVDKLISDKRQIIRKSNTLEFIDSEVSLDDIGGLDIAKKFFSKYKNVFTDEAVKFGVEPLRGVLLVGVPGAGKSLFFKAIGKLWKMPPLIFDVGKAMGSLVGQSEAKMRETIAQAEAMAPCLLILDEVEKALSGTGSSDKSDGGTMARVFGTLLTAMQDGLKGVTIIATANSIEKLPPEFIRRFNEVFFVDIPGPDERWDIFRIHLKKRGRDIANFEKDKELLLEKSNGFTGAEIEKAIKDAIAQAFDEGKGDIKSSLIINALSETKPISVLMGDKIAKMREFAKNRARYASSWAEAQSKGLTPQQQKKELDLNAALDSMEEIASPVQKEKKQSTKSRMSSLIIDEKGQE